MIRNPPAVSSEYDFVDYVIEQTREGFRVFRQKGKWVLGNKSMRTPREGLVIAPDGANYIWTEAGAMGFSDYGDAADALADTVLR